MLVDADLARKAFLKACKGKRYAAACVEAIRQADLSDCRVDDDAMVRMCDAYAKENQQFSDQIESLSAELSHTRAVLRSMECDLRSEIVELKKDKEKS